MNQQTANDNKHLAKPCNEAIKTIVRGYVWKPQVGEFCMLHNDMRLILYSYDTEILMFDFLTHGIDLFRREYIDKQLKEGHCIPILSWETIEEILEGVGYEVNVFDIQIKRRRWLCQIWKKGKLKDTAPRNKLVASVDNCKSRQPAVMKALIVLGKEKND